VLPPKAKASKLIRMFVEAAGTDARAPRRCAKLTTFRLYWKQNPVNHLQPAFMVFLMRPYE
jgi:hypothetical protein